MQFDSPLIPARLIRRYKRFLADVRLDDGPELTCAVGNTGSMLGLTTPGSRVLLAHNPRPSRKYAHDLLMVEADGTWVGVNTGLPNRLAEEAIDAGLLPTLAGYRQRLREQRYDLNCRIDLLLQGAGQPDCYVEVKNVHLMRRAGLAEFPDSVTARGAKHLEALARRVAAGDRAVMLYVNQRDDVHRLRLAEDCDPTYAAAARRAADAGVAFLALACRLTAQEITAHRAIPVELPPYAD